MVANVCALCGQPPGNAKWKAGDSWCHGCKNYICFDCHVKTPHLVPSGPHGLEIHQKGEFKPSYPNEVYRPTVQPKPVIVSEQKGLEETMPIIVSAGSSKTYTPAPAGSHSGVCVDIVDLGLEKNKFDATKPDVRKGRIILEIDEDNPDKPGERFTVAGKWTLSLHPKASLRKLLASWRGRDFTEEEAKAFDIEKLVGAPCLVNVVHNIGEDGQVYANIASISPLPKGMKAIKPSSTYVRVLDRPKKEDTSVNPSAPAGSAVPF